MCRVDAITALVQRVQARRRLPSPPARRLLREQAGLSQQDVADALGVTRTAVSLWEAGDREPRPAHRERYLELLDRIAGAS
jgi:DNA-binding transcriptional regulator YiaG